MLNEEKIKLMTSISMFEKKEGKRIFRANRYFKGDYVSNHMLRSFFCYTFCWLLGIMLWALYHSESLLQNIMLDEIIELFIQFGSYYGIGLVVYLIITVVVYNKRHNYASRGLRIYVAKLKRLEKYYESPVKSKDA